MSKVGGSFCITTGEVILGGIGGTKSKGIVHRRGGLNDAVQRFVVYMVTVVNTFWERMSGSVMTAAMRAGFCCWRREYTISILQILTLIQYS